MLWYKKFLLRAEAALITKNIMSIGEKLAWYIHCFLFIYYSVFSQRNWKQNLSFVIVGLIQYLFIYLFVLPPILKLISPLESMNGIVPILIKWQVILLNPFLWFVGLPCMIFLIEGPRRDRNNKSY